MHRTALAAMLLSTTMALGAAPRPPQKLATVEGITEYDLDNGLRVLLFPDSSRPTVTVNVTYFVGSRVEGYGETGMAHLLEHMVFKGTPKHPKVMNTLENMGGFFNGSTAYDRTNYFVVLPSTAENLKTALELEADCMINSNIAASDLKTEFSVVRNEFEMGENNPREILSERMLESAYIWHNYGKPTIGSRADIERVPIDNLKAFYKRFYQPDNAMLIVAGKFDEAAALKLIQTTFGAIPRPARKLSDSYTIEPVQDGERTVTLRRTGDLALASLMYHGVAGADADYPAEEALLDLLTDKPSGRLYRALVEKGLAARVEGSVEQWKEPGVLQILAEVRDPATLNSVRDKMIEIVEGVAKGKISDDELNRFKTKQLKQFELLFNDSVRVGIFLSEYAALGDWRMLFVYKQQLKDLTTEQVRKAAAAWLRPSNRTVGLFVPTKAPERSPLAPQPDVAALVKAYQPAAAVAAGETFEATVENIEKRTQRSTLANGMKLALLAKKTRGATVKLTLAIHYGSEKDLAGRIDAARLVSPMLMRGTAKHTYQQLKDELDRLRAEVQTESRGLGAAGPGSATLSVTTVRESLPAVLALVAEMVQQPTFPAAELETLRKERQAQLQESLQNPQALGFTELLRKLQPYAKDDVRYQPSLAERLERIGRVKLADVAATHHELWGGGAAELAVVGDFEPAEMKAAVEKLFGAWKSQKPYARVPTPYQAVAPSAAEIDTPDKEMALVTVGQPFDLRDDDAEYPAIELANHIIGGAAKSRLFERLRQKEGLSYGAFSFINTDSIDRGSFFVAGAICAPQNAAKALDLVVEELGIFLKGGVAAQELAEAKKSYQAFFDNQLSFDDFIAGALVEGLHLGRTLEFQKKVNARVQQLSGPELVAGVAKHLDLTRLVRLRVGDLNPKKK